MHLTHFPLHPTVPPEGMSYDELFAGRSFDIPTMMREMAARMAAEGLAYDGARRRTCNTRLAQELSAWVTATGRPSLDSALFQAMFVESRNIGLEDELMGIVERAGLPVEEAREVLRERTYKAAVDAHWARARAIGVTGVPTYVVADPVGGRPRGVVGAQPYAALVQLAVAGGAQRRIA